MPEKSEIAAQKKTIKLAPAIGDWTTYKPPKLLVRKIKSGLYGFDRLSEDELDLVLNANYRFTAKLLNRFKNDLKLAVELFTLQVEQTTYYNFLRTLTGPVVQARLLIPGFTEALTLVLDLSLANTIINHALGSRDLEPANRGLTEAENSVFTAALGEYLPDFAASFANAFTPPELTILSSPDATVDQAISPSATFVAFSAEVALGENPPGKIIIGYLGSMLKPLLAAYAQKQSARLLNFARLSNTLLSKVTVPVQAQLGETTLTTNDLRQLEIGDVVTLETAINAAITLKIGKLLTLLGQPGVKDRKISIRLADLEAEELTVEPPPLEDNLPTEPAKPASPPAPAEAKPVETTELLDEEFSDEDFEDLFDEEDNLEAKEEK